MTKTFDKNNYNFIDLTKTDFNDFSELELDKLIEDTKEVLSMTKGKVTKSPMNIGLAGGLLAVRGGEFKSINALTGAKWTKGNTSKEEQKLLKKVFSTGRLYYLFKVVIVLIAQKDGQQDLLNPTLAQKIK